MRKISLNLILIITTIFSISLTAQNHSFCGMTRADLDEVGQQLLTNRAEMAGYVFDRDVEYVPIRFHIVSETDGSGGTSERTLLNALCILNENYADQEIQFYLYDLNYINSSSLYNDPQSFNGQFGISSNMQYDAINIFCVGEIPANNGSGTVLAYYQPPAGPQGNDWIVSRNSELTDNNTLTHEMGHFFSLLHPFNGWDFNPHDSALHGDPVSSFNSPEGVQVERADGVNCANAGDFICDTPADYNFISGNCNYTGGVRDPLGVPVDPDEELFMNYFNCNNYYFSDGQKEVVQNSLFSNSRNYVRKDYTPNTAEITGNTSLISPAQLEKVEGYNYVELVWEAKDGADNYLVEIAGAQSFNLIVNDNIAVLQDVLEPDATYLWKVTPFSDGYTCANSSLQQIFRTPDNFVAVTTVEEIEEWQIIPNPVAAQEMINIQVNASESFQADVTIINIAGAMIKQANAVNFINGNSNYRMDVSDLTAGLYNVSIRTEKGVSNQKLVVAY